jgi:hypothetical protein
MLLCLPAGRYKISPASLLEYDLKIIDLEITAIEDSATRLKKMGDRIEAIERNVDAILGNASLKRGWHPMIQQECF